MNWIPLTEESQLDDIIALSHTKPVAIYKHSTRCSISVVVKRALESEWTLTTDQLPVYYLDLLSYRPISNKIASIFSVDHESPQLIIIKDGKAVYDASHADITFADLPKAA